ncbi:MAG: lipase family protein [Crocinitomicaceae bacterium]|nr:lipase family protein [Crocinitomicaceae bacterium]
MLVRVFILLGFFYSLNLSSQTIRPGFDVKEMYDLLNMSAHQFDQEKWKEVKDLPELPKGYELVYRAKDSGLKNSWDLFTNGKKAVISIRGSVGALDSWLENFHAGMIPANGKLVLPDSTTFQYKLADHPKALVHAGWTYGMGSMAKDILDKIQNYYQQGYRDFYLVGFSQGAGIVQLLDSYLHYLPENKIPKDIRLKTYAFACPKPGNSFFSLDYGLINRGGWEFRIINMEDWVPHVPFSVQKVMDMPENNPFVGIKKAFKSLKPLQRMVLKGIYNKLNRKVNAASNQFTKVMGTLVGKFIGKRYPDLKIEAYAASFDYCAAGTSVILTSAEVPDSLSATRKIFFHHMPNMYLKRVKHDFKLDY